MSNSTEEELSLDVMDNVTRQNSSDPDWRQEEMAAKMVLEGILLPIISSFGFLGKIKMANGKILQIQMKFVRKRRKNRGNT